MSDILIGVTVFGLAFGAAIFGMFLGKNLRVLEQKVNASDPPSPRLRRAKQTFWDDPFCHSPFANLTGLTNPP